MHLTKFTDDGKYDTTGSNVIASQDSPTYPWTSKANFITSLLFSSPCHPFSDGQKKATINWARELGAWDVPSFGTVKKVQKHIDCLIGDPTEKVLARSGDIFYINNIAESIARDYANPLTQFAMQDYPEDGGDGMSQVFNGMKMLLDLPSPPAVRVDGTIYFVNELLQESSKAYFIPECFFLGSCPSANEVEPGAQSNVKIQYALGRAAGFIVNDEQEILPTSVFVRSFKDISATSGELECGLTVQWNKHHTIYMSNANLPHEMLEKEFFVRFVTSSPHTAPMELIVAAESGIVAWDCKDNQEVMLITYVLFVAGDNPMQAEECSHVGLNCNYYCRTCEVGGTKEYKESEAGYNSIFNQFETAILSGASEKLGKKLRKCIAGSPALPENEVRIALEKEFEQLLQGRRLDDAINPLLGMHAFNVHMDMPTEILHTVLLSIVKYFWGQTVFLLKKSKLLHLFQNCLETINKDALNAPYLNADYICHYKGSLIGKHFKSLAQDVIKHVAMGGYWYDGEIKKWVCAGIQVLSYLDEHPKQAWLLGLSNFSHSVPISGSGKVETVTGKSGKTVWKDAVPWKDTRCANIPGTAPHDPCIEYYQGKCVVTSTGENPADGKAERTLTSRSRCIVQHKLTPHYILNAYSIHNYDYICLVTPDTLHETPLRVTNVAKQMQEKRAAKKSGDVPQQGEGGHIDNVPAPHAVFDCAPAVKTGAKPKAKSAVPACEEKRRLPPTFCTASGTFLSPADVYSSSVFAPSCASIIHATTSLIHDSSFTLRPTTHFSTNVILPSASTPPSCRSITLASTPITCSFIPISSNYLASRPSNIFTSTAHTSFSPYVTA
ncbi:uncharacterized protein F5147DRAFT_747791 [Suillus discolor]|uniref:Uncharacterized protein n=1 Tax=Suillus discolor TaxID=1912936 RepID=A0A9P7EW65_9AGAM|nr:uncharacterized protein F5147DRAFT_747791 [Suillus discolor]KAG2094609.1 hypothetical protein F5147DRAFT_747791 [Suillus discolor]